jgi:hypothetical protein
MQFLERRTKGPPNPWFVPMAKPRKPVVSIRSEPLGFHRLKAVVSSRMKLATSIKTWVIHRPSPAVFLAGVELIQARGGGRWDTSSLIRLLRSPE